MKAEFPLVTRVVPTVASDMMVGRRSKVTNIVIHIAESTTLEGTVAHLSNPSDPKVSAHFVIGHRKVKEGIGPVEVVQMVSVNDTAYHAGSANSFSIGIEHIAHVHWDEILPKKLLDGRIIPGRKAAFPLLPTTEMYQASARLCRAICDMFHLPFDLNTIQGHAMIDKRTNHKQCPEGAWSWSEFKRFMKQ